MNIALPETITVVEVCPADAIITPLIQPNATTRVLFCDSCGDWMMHKFFRRNTQKFYACEYCGCETMYFIVRRSHE